MAFILYYAPTTHHGRLSHRHHRTYYRVVRLDLYERNDWLQKNEVKSGQVKFKRLGNQIKI